VVNHSRTGLKPGILFLINDLQAGGAEMFLKRLGEGLSGEYQPWIGVLNPSSNQADFQRFFFEGSHWKEFPLYQYPETSLADQLFWKANAVLRPFGFANTYLKLKKAKEQRAWQHRLKKNRIVLVNSNSSASDAFVAKQLKPLVNLPWVLTQHSSYNRVRWGILGSEKEFINHAAAILGKTDAILYTAEDNVDIYSHVPLSAHTIFKKVYLGYEPQRDIPEKSDHHKPLKLVMMARGIPEKGWEQALQAIQILNAKQIQVELQAIYSPTEYMETLKQEYAGLAGVNWLGYLSNPAPLLAAAHASLLPSYFQESLPYAITESLAYGTPVIALPVAEIPSMLSTEWGLAGQLLQADPNGKAQVEGLAMAIQTYMDSPDCWSEHSRLARLAFASKFSLQTCLQAYKEVFDALTKIPQEQLR
jgi:glycosyltransferase involved in cell wall biosynthesis